MKILLDFDGCVNVFRNEDSPNPDGFTYKETELEFDGDVYRITYSQEVVDWINSRDDIVWLTTWERDTPKFDKLGIKPDIPFIKTDAVTMLERRQGLWKHRAGRNFIIEHLGEDIIWIDDDYRVNDLPGVHRIVPNDEIGITRADIERVSLFS